MSDWQKRNREAGERFTADTSEHELIVLHDDGLYRHLRFKRPGTTFYWFDLVTWPGYLSITGDMGAHTFARTSDMFGFFASGVGINPGYWGEKLVADSGFRKHSATLFTEWVKEQYDEARDDSLKNYEEGDKEDTSHWERVLAELEEQVLENAEFESEAIDSVYDWNRHYADETGFTLSADDLDFKDYTYRYLWCCHAIRWGVERYWEVKREGE